MKLCQFRNARSSIGGAAIRRSWRRDVKLRCYQFCRSLFFLKKIRHHTKYTSIVWTSVSKIHCMVILIRSYMYISAVSWTVTRRSVSITFRTNVNAISLVKVGMSPLSLSFFETLPSLNRLCHLQTKALKHWGNKKMSPGTFWSILDYTRLGSRKTGLSPPVFLYWPFQGSASVVVPYCYLFLLSVFILWFSYYFSDIFCKF